MTCVKLAETGYILVEATENTMQAKLYLSRRAGVDSVIG